MQKFAEDPLLYYEINLVRNDINGLLNEKLIVVPGAVNKALVAARRILTEGAQASLNEKFYEEVEPAEAAAEGLFARGWLPEIIPASSKASTMRNDLDLNESTGEFKLDPSDHDPFVTQLQRTPSHDTTGFSAYRFQDWIFWISHDKNQCRFHMRLSHHKSQP